MLQIWLIKWLIDISSFKIYDGLSKPQSVRTQMDLAYIGIWWQACKFLNYLPNYWLYTETIKLCPFDVYVCQFQMYVRISFKFSHYQLWSFRNILHLKEIYLLISRAVDKAANTSTLKIKSHNINSLCVRHNPEFLSTFKHRWVISKVRCYAC